MSDQELEAEDWYRPNGEPTVTLVLSEGTKLYASRDSEGNGPGCLFGVTTQGQHFFVAVG